ncbi:MAG: hypothetical protein ABJA70_19555 [Chryseolinea sp.]
MPKIAYRETIRKSANAIFRHKKQFEGSGQFGEVHMKVEAYAEGMQEPAKYTIRDRQIIELNWAENWSFTTVLLVASSSHGLYPLFLKV